MAVDETKWSVQGVRVAITGGSEGLGLAMARHLAAAGAQVWIGSRHRDHVNRALALSPNGSQAMAGTVLDVTLSESIEGWLRAMEKAWGGIDVLVNNAGLGMRTVNPWFFERPMPFWEVPEEGFRRVLDTNLTGYFLTAKAVVPRFMSHRRGKIVNVTMNHETMRRKGFTPYGPSRAGAEALSRIMAEDLSAAGITVNLLLPGGASDTKMIPEAVSPDFRRQLLPAAVMGPPIRFLCSPQADGMTNQRIVATDFEAWLADLA